MWAWGVQAFNPNTQEAEEDRSLYLQDQPGLNSMFKAIWATGRTCLKKKERNKQKAKRDT